MRLEIKYVSLVLDFVKLVKFLLLFVLHVKKVLIEKVQPVHALKAFMIVNKMFAQNAIKIVKHVMIICNAHLVIQILIEY